LNERVLVTYELESNNINNEVSKEKILSDIFPEDLVEICDE
jgi:hypothetical protein